MARKMMMTSAQMMPRSASLKKGQAPSGAGTTLQVPVGGQVSIRKAENGLMVSVTDGSYRTVREVVVTDPSNLKIE